MLSDAFAAGLHGAPDVLSIPTVFEGALLDPVIATFLIFLAVGFFAQLIDGAVGMAYGVVSATVLLAFGVPPANVSASVHAAKVFTCAGSAAAHAANRNVNYRLMFWLALAGSAGGVAGAHVVTSIDGDTLKPLVVAYLGIMGLVILSRVRAATRPVVERFAYPVPLGLTGGLLDAIGGGGWGPTVTTTLVGSGVSPRLAIGSTNAAEFFVAVAVSTTFITILLTGSWEDAPELMDHIWPVAGLIVGGLIAAPFAAMITRVLPTTRMTLVVGLLVVGLATWQGLQLAKLI